MIVRLRPSGPFAALLVGACALGGCAETEIYPAGSEADESAGQGGAGPTSSGPGEPTAAVPAPAPLPDPTATPAPAAPTAPVDPVDPVTTTAPATPVAPTAPGSEPGLLFDPSIADLDSVALELRRRVIGDARAALAGLNADYVAGALDEERFGCAGPEWPTLEYFCGDENGAGEPLDYGVPVHSFAFADDPGCREAVEAGVEGLAACTVRFVHLDGDEAHDVRYRLRFVDGELVERLDIAAGGSEVAVDPDLGAEVCGIVYADAAEYTDESVCDELVRAVLGR